MYAKKLTQEEKVLMAIYRTPGDADIDPIGKQLGLSDKSFRHTIHLLLRGNFIVKAGPEAVRLTAHGKKLCLHIEEEA